MQKLLYCLMLFSSVMLQAHTSFQEPNHLSQPSLPWYGVIDKKDLAVAATISATFCAGSFFIQDKKTRAAVQAVALLAPLVRLLSTTGIVKKTFNNVPLVKEIFGCNAQDCQGICNECVMRQTLIDGGIGVALVSLTAPIAQFLSKRRELKEKEKAEHVKNEKETIEKEVIKKECDLCTVDKEEQYCASPLCCKEKTICGTCLKLQYQAKEHMPFVPCPWCNQEIICPMPEEEAPQVDIIERTSELTKSPTSKTTPSLPADPLSVFFNKTLVVGGVGIASCASLFSYADHRATVKDGALTVACCGGLLALASQIKDPVKQKQLLVAALIIPFIGLLNKSETIRSIGKKLPLLNHAFECENQACTSICAHCKLRNAQRGAAALIGSMLIAGGL